MRHCSLIRIECCPFRPPLTASRRLAGGTFKVSNLVAASTNKSFRRPIFCKSGPKRFVGRHANKASVCRQEKVRITADNVSRYYDNVKRYYLARVYRLIPP